MPRLVLACLAVLLVAAAPARAEVQRASAGAVTAELSFQRAADGYGYTGMAFSIVRAGQVAYSGLPALKGCVEPSCAPGGGDGPSVHVSDLDGDGEPEVLLDRFTGGAHCCVVTHLFAWAGTGYRVIKHDFADAGYGLEDLGGRVHLVSADTRFAYAWAPFAFSLFPVQILRYAGGRLGDVTGEFPDRIRSDARRAWRAYGSLRRDGMEVRGAIAAWAANRYRLGERASTLRSLRRMARRGLLRGAYPKSQTAFVRRLDRQLLRWGYRP